MKRFLLATVSGLLILSAWSRGDETAIPPDEGAKRDDWIFEHYTDLCTRQFELLRLSKDYPKEAVRPVSPDLAAKIKIGTSFKIVLAVLGLPTEQHNETGGSGPIKLPESWWIYTLTDGSQMRITFQFNKTLSDVVVTHVTAPKIKEPQSQQAD